MENNENIAIEQIDENVEQTTEETAKTYSQEEFDQKVKERLDQILPGKIARNEAKIRKEYEGRYGALENVLKAGTGKSSVEEITDSFRKFYTGKGVSIPDRPAFSQRDDQILGKADAEDIIGGGYDEVTAESDRLAKIGLDKMTPRQKETFRTLAEYRRNTDRGRELSALGVAEEVYNGEDFRRFAEKFSPTTPTRDIYELFRMSRPRKQVATMGSMRNRQDTGPKDFYTPEEIASLTEEDLDDPKVWEAVRRSMTGGA